MHSFRGSVVVGLFLTAGAFAQEANEILAKVMDAYRLAESYHFVGSNISESRTGKKAGAKSEVRFEVAWSKPNKVKVEYQYPDLGTWVRVSDGTTYTHYRTATKTFKQDPASPDDLRIVLSSPVGKYENANEGVSTAKLVGSETIQAAGRSVECFVLEVDYQSRTTLPNMVNLPIKLWVDKSSYLVLRESTGSRSTSTKNPTEEITSTEFSVAELNTALPETVFAFKKDK